jgi:hypothetical protein
MIVGISKKPYYSVGGSQMAFDLAVRCPHPNCEFYQRPFQLLVASAESVADSLASWTEQKTEFYLACPGCRRVSVHRRAEVHDFHEDNLAATYKGKVWIRVALLCGAEGCNSPADLHVLLNQASNNQLASELQKKLAAKHWTGFLPCGHAIASVGQDRWYFERSFGGPWGYKPFDLRLAALPKNRKKSARRKYADRK